MSQFAIRGESFGEEDDDGSSVALRLGGMMEKSLPGLEKPVVRRTRPKGRWESSSFEGGVSGGGGFAM